MFKCLWLIAAAALIFHSSVEAGFVDDLNPDADVPGHGLGDRHLLQMDSSSSSQLQQTTGLKPYLLCHPVNFGGFRKDERYLPSGCYKLQGGKLTLDLKTVPFI